MTALRKGWTPERIEGRLAVEFPDDPRMRVSHECLYQWIYAKPQRILDLRQYLPRGKRRRTRAKGRRSKGPRIPMRVPIAQRVFCQVGVGRFGVSFSPCERRVSGRFGVGRSCWLLVIALVIA